MTHGILVLPAGCDRDDWLAVRRTGIGASEIAAVLGVSPYDSPFSLYWRKKLGTEVDANEDMEWGLRLEDPIAVKFAEQHPEFDVQPGGLYRHHEHDWMLATPDRLLYDHPCPRIGDHADCRAVELAQVKTTYSFDDWGEPGTDEIPVYYRAQVMQEMDVHGARRVHLPVLASRRDANGKRYREYVVDYDPEDAALGRKAGGEFMRRLADEDPPDIDGSAATARTIKALHPTVIDESVTVPLSVADQYRVRAELLADAQAAYDETYNQLLAATGNYRYAVADGRKVATRSVYDQTHLDTKRLKKQRPELAAEIYAEFGETSTVCKLIPLKETS